jgi:hypothetical protein
VTWILWYHYFFLSRHFLKDCILIETRSLFYTAWYLVLVACDNDFVFLFVITSNHLLIPSNIFVSARTRGPSDKSWLFKEKRKWIFYYEKMHPTRLYPNINKVLKNIQVKQHFRNYFLKPTTTVLGGHLFLYFGAFSKHGFPTVNLK